MVNAPTLRVTYLDYFVCCRMKTAAATSPVITPPPIIPTTLATSTKILHQLYVQQWQQYLQQYKKHQWHQQQELTTKNIIASNVSIFNDATINT